MEINTLTKEQILNMAILSYMVGDVGRYIRFSALANFPLEQQYEIVTKIAEYIEGKTKQK